MSHGKPVMAFAILRHPIFTERESNVMKIHFKVVLLSLLLSNFKSLKAFPVLERAPQKWVEKIKAFSIKGGLVCH